MVDLVGAAAAAAGAALLVAPPAVLLGLLTAVNVAALVSLAPRFAPARADRRPPQGFVKPRGFEPLAEIAAKEMQLRAERRARLERSGETAPSATPLDLRTLPAGARIPRTSEERRALRRDG